MLCNTPQLMIEQTGLFELHTMSPLLRRLLKGLADQILVWWGILIDLAELFTTFFQKLHVTSYCYNCWISRESGGPFDWPEDMNLPTFSFLAPVSLHTGKGIMFPSPPWNIHVISDYYCNQYRQVWHYTQCVSFQNHCKKPSARIMMFSMYKQSKIHDCTSTIDDTKDTKFAIIARSQNSLVIDYTYFSKTVGV